MENEIKKLIEKYNRENIVPLLSAVPIWIVIRDLESLLELYKSVPAEPPWMVTRDFESILESYQAQKKKEEK